MQPLLALPVPPVVKHSNNLCISFIHCTLLFHDSVVQCQCASESSECVVNVCVETYRGQCGSCTNLHLIKCIRRWCSLVYGLAANVWLGGVVKYNCFLRFGKRAERGSGGEKLLNYQSYQQGLPNIKCPVIISQSQSDQVWCVVIL